MVANKEKQRLHPLCKPCRISKGNGKFRLVFVYTKNYKNLLCRLATLIQETIPVSVVNLAYEKGCSIQKAGYALKGHSLICSADFKDHFGSILRIQVKEMLMHHGYQEPIAWSMSRLACVQYGGRDFLPQGSPASPVISNRVTEYLLDKSIQEEFPEAKYYRYSDNLYLCYDSKQVTGTEIIDKLQKVVSSRVKWRLHKLKVMPYYKQQKCLGLVVNQEARMPRHDFDLLKAVLYNCVKDLPKSIEKSNSTGYIESNTAEEFISKLTGKVRYWTNFVTESQKQKLNTLLEKINEKIANNN